MVSTRDATQGSPRLTFAAAQPGWDSPACRRCSVPRFRQHRQWTGLGSSAGACAPLRSSARMGGACRTRLERRAPTAGVACVPPTGRRGSGAASCPRPAGSDPCDRRRGGAPRSAARPGASGPQSRARDRHGARAVATGRWRLCLGLGRCAGAGRRAPAARPLGRRSPAGAAARAHQAMPRPRLRLDLPGHDQEPPPALVRDVRLRQPRQDPPLSRPPVERSATKE
jgi:hypothetical protein